MTAQKLHDELYFGEGERVEMTPRALLEQYVQFVDDRVDLSAADVLDFGCGTAPTGHLVEAGGGTYVGVEFSAGARRHLEAQGLEVAPDLAALAHRRFDVAFLIEVIEHLPDPVGTLTSLRELLVRGGHLFIVTPNAAGLKSRIEGDRWEQAALPAHILLFDARSLRSALRRAGYEIVARQRWLDQGRALPIAIGHRLLQAAGLDGGLRILAIPTRR